VKIALRARAGAGSRGGHADGRPIGALIGGAEDIAELKAAVDEPGIDGFPAAALTESSMRAEVPTPVRPLLILTQLAPLLSLRKMPVPATAA
jgi:hypothetical protein